MAHWYVLRGAWLCSGKGMHDAKTPKIVLGWISQCVYRMFSDAECKYLLLDFIAIIAKFCSAGSMYSMTDSPMRQFVSKSFQLSSLFATRCTISGVISARLSRTRKTGRVSRPPSLHTRISMCLQSNTTDV
jgi:hypothetical protein